MHKMLEAEMSRRFPPGRDEDPWYVQICEQDAPKKKDANAPAKNATEFLKTKLGHNTDRLIDRLIHRHTDRVID